MRYFRQTGLAIFICLMPGWLPAQAVDSIHWVRLSASGVELYTSSSRQQGEDTLGRFLRLRAFYKQTSPQSQFTDTALRIVQFGTEAQFAPWAPTEATISFFRPGQSHEYIVMGERGSKELAPSFHQYAHLLVAQNGLKLPVWFLEGWAEVLTTVRAADGQGGKDSAAGEVLPERVKSLTSDTWLDFDTLASVDTRSPLYGEGSRTGIFYSESWTLVHMLFLAPEYKNSFGNFVTALQSGKTSREACQTAFGRTPVQVLADLKAYVAAQRFQAAVFKSGPDAQVVTIDAKPLAEFDAKLMLADLKVAVGKPEEAKADYARLEQEQPRNAELLQAVGTLAIAARDLDTARKYFARSYEAGGADAQMCFQLAVLYRQARLEAGKIIPVLERALRSRPDFPEAKIQLGLLKVDARDFAGAVALLNRLPAVNPEQAAAVFCALAYAQIQSGDAAGAQQSIQTCGKSAKTDQEVNAATRMGKFIEARSRPSVGLRPGEKLQQVIGVARSVECSPEVNRLVIAVGEKTAMFDLPAPDAVEMPTKPTATLTFACGPLAAVRIGVEFAPPRTAVETSIGIVRRMIY